jgi:hypothetical protein
MDLPTGVSLPSPYSSLKASLSRFNNVTTAECKCGYGMQTEEYIFWDWQLYEDEKVTMMDILSENSNKKPPIVIYRAVKPKGIKIC